MTKRAEFLPAENPLLYNYNALLEAAELVIRHECSRCDAVIPEKHCLGCACSPLRQTLAKINGERIQEKGGNS
jgi:hypothetical protein